MPCARAPIAHRCGANDRAVANTLPPFSSCNAPSTWDELAAYTNSYYGQYMVGASAGEEAKSRRARPPPTYPPKKFLGCVPPGHFFHASDSEGKTPGAFQNLSSFKGIEQPILYMVEGVGLKTLTTRLPESSIPDSLVREVSAWDSRPVRKVSKNSHSSPESSVEVYLETQRSSAPKGASGSQQSTQAPDAYYTSTVQESVETNIVTVMVCNLPRRVTQERLALATDELGFSGMYNLVYIPKGAKFSAGYGFVNFINAEVAQSFRVAFDGFMFPEFQSSKRAFTQAAKAQGLIKTLDSIRRGGNFRNRCIFPLLFNNGSDPSFEDFAVGLGGAFL